MSEAQICPAGNLSDSTMRLAQPGQCVRPCKEGLKEEQVKQGKLQLGNEAIPVEYELQTVVANNKRETTGRLVLRQPPGIQLSTALTEMTGANLVTDDGHAHWVEFTRNIDGTEIEFIASPPRGVIVNR